MSLQPTKPRIFLNLYNRKYYQIPVRFWMSENNFLLEKCENDPCFNVSFNFFIISEKPVSFSTFIMLSSKARRRFFPIFLFGQIVRFRMTTSAITLCLSGRDEKNWPPNKWKLHRLLVLKWHQKSRKKSQGKEKGIRQIVFPLENYFKNSHS